MRAVSFMAFMGLGLCWGTVSVADDKPGVGFLHKTLTDARGEKVPYVVFVPHKYDGKTQFPVILFLHGGGEKKPIPWGLGTYIQEHEKTFDFITVIPHAEKAGWAPGSLNGKHALQALDEVMQSFKTDPSRVYLTGFSMGGQGTWDMGAHVANKWAALVPVAGGGKVEWAEKCKDIPVWAFHGDDDPAMPVARTREMIAAMEKLGVHPKYTERPKVGHTPDYAYRDKELYRWLKEQKRKL